MSYILDSLKKSDKERQSINNSAAMVMRSPAFLENDKRPHNPLVWMVLVVVVLSLVIYFGFFQEFSSNQFFSSQKNELLVNSKPIIRKEIVIAPPQEQLSQEKQEAILLYEQALQQKSQPEIDSLYKELNDKAVKTEGDVATIQPEQALDDEDDNPNRVTSSTVTSQSVISNIKPHTVTPVLKNAVTVVSAPEDEGITSVVSSRTEAANNVAILTEQKQKSNSNVVIPSIYALDSTVKKKIPSINYGAHIYATDNKSGFVILNGARRRIGDKLSNGVFVEKIAEESVVLSFNGTVFSLPAMKSWIGE